MTTKEQERQAIEKIRKIVEGLGENSYVGFAMEGVLELAEDNIREDTAYSMKKNAEIAWEREDEAEKENKDLKKHQGKAKAEDGRINRGKGADQGSGTRSSLMWETIHIIEQMGKWKPKYVIWENVRNVTSRHMIANFIRYQKEMERMGYTNNYEVLDAREFGLPQARERVFTISVLGGEKFQFDELIRTPMRSIDEFLEKNEEVPEVYDVTQPSVREVIGVTGSVRRATVIEDYAFTITTRQDRTPAQVIDCGNGRYRYLTELECWRLQGYTDEDFERAKKAQQKKGRYYTALYKQAGNSIAVPIFESIFRKIILNEVREKEEQR